MTDIVDKLRNAPRQPDCKHGNRPKSCLECDIEELEAENTASMTEITRLRAENERLSTKLSNTASARVLQGKAIAELSAENERLRWMVRRLQERIRQLIQDNMLLAHDDTAEWGLEELMKDVGDSNE